MKHKWKQQWTIQHFRSVYISKVSPYYPWQLQCFRLQPHQYGTPTDVCGYASLTSFCQSIASIKSSRHWSCSSRMANIENWLRPKWDTWRSQKENLISCYMMCDQIFSVVPWYPKRVPSHHLPNLCFILYLNWLWKMYNDNCICPSQAT